MLEIPSLEKMDVPNATVDFGTFTQDGLKYVVFDTSKCSPPEPMVNAMIALEMVNNGTSAVMINHKSPAGLLDKIQNKFQITESDLPNGNVMLIFAQKC